MQYACLLLSFSHPASVWAFPSLFLQAWQCFKKGWGRRRDHSENWKRFPNWRTGYNYYIYNTLYYTLVTRIMTKRLAHQDANWEICLGLKQLSTLSSDIYKLWLGEEVRGKDKQDDWEENVSLDHSPPTPRRGVGSCLLQFIGYGDTGSRRRWNLLLNKHA